MKEENKLKFSQFIIIDDDPLHNLICRMAIETTCGMMPSKSFTNPGEGLRYLQSSFANEELKTVMLLDINMPIMTGWEFLERFDSLPEVVKKCVHIYVLSSSVDERDKDRACANKNVVDFLTKPLTKESILKIFGS